MANKLNPAHSLLSKHIFAAASSSCSCVEHPQSSNVYVLLCFVSPVLALVKDRIAGLSETLYP